jgi:hypothetical protein
VENLQALVVVAWVSIRTLQTPQKLTLTNGDMINSINCRGKVKNTNIHITIRNRALKSTVTRIKMILRFVGANRICHKQTIILKVNTSIKGTHTKEEVIKVGVTSIAIGMIIQSTTIHSINRWTMEELEN